MQHSLLMLSCQCVSMCRVNHIFDHFIVQMAMSASVLTSEPEPGPNAGWPQYMSYLDFIQWGQQRVKASHTVPQAGCMWLLAGYLWGLVWHSAVCGKRAGISSHDGIEHSCSMESFCDLESIYWVCKSGWVTGGRRDAVTGGRRNAVTGGHRGAVAGGHRDAVAGGHRDAVTGGHRDAVTGGHRDAARPHRAHRDAQRHRDALTSGHMDAGHAGHPQEG
jgi:hypothetical protein